MSNTLSVIDMVAAKAMAIAHEKATFIGTVNRAYDDSFAKTGGKIGSTLRIREPNKYTRRQGSRVMDVQDTTETTQTVTLATQDGVDIRFNSAELALSIDELTARYIEPAVSQLVSAIDGDAIANATKQVYNLVGTAGTAIGAVTSGFSDTSALGAARAKLNMGLAPKDSNRALQLDSVTMSALANGIKPLQNPQADISKAWREGFIARTALADLYENDRVHSHTVGSDVTTMTLSGAGGLASGDTYFSISGATMVSGDVFTVSGVYAVHPETKVAYAHLQQFVVTAVSGSAYSVSPPIISSGAKQTVNAVAVSAATVTAIGTASTAYRQPLMYHKDFFTFVTADLPIMDDAHRCTRITKDGLSLRVWQASDIRNDELLMRIDILYGMKVLRPEWACRLIGSASA